MSDLPDGSNFYSSLQTTMTPRQVAQLYGAIGWRVRKCSYYDYQVRGEWADLVIESTKPILMHGRVADILVRIEELIAPLRVAGISFSAECYGPYPEEELLLEVQSQVH